MRLSDRGKRFLLILLTIAFITLLSPDPMIQTTSLVLSLTFLIDALLLRSKMKMLKEIKASPETLDLRATVGGKVTRKITVNKPVRNVISPERWLELKVVKVEKKSSEILLEAAPKLSGVYRINTIKEKLLSPLGVFEEYVDIKLNLTLNLYPKAFPAIIGIIAFLQGAGVMGGGVFHGKKRGQGLEYAETREYIPGDPLRFIDWKATARFSKLMVKEFLEEEYGIPYVIFNSKAPGPILADELSYLFLSTILGLALEGLPVTLIFKRESESIVMKSLAPGEAVKRALTYVLETYPSLEWEIYELVEPKSRGKLLKFFRQLERGASTRQRLSVKEAFHAGREGPMIYVGLPTYEASTLVRISDKARTRGTRLYVITPKKPWRDLKDLEEAYVLYMSHEKTLNALLKSGAIVKSL